MEQKEYQLDYSAGEEPLLILPLCVGAMLLSGKVFAWFSSLDGGRDEELMIFMKLFYWGVILCCGGLAAWRLIRTIHATPKGLEFRCFGRAQEVIPWEEFSCAVKGRAWQYKRDQLYLIPANCGPLPEDARQRYKFLTRNYREKYRFHPTKNNIQAINTYLRGLDHD